MDNLRILYNPVREYWYIWDKTKNRRWVDTKFATQARAERFIRNGYTDVRTDCVRLGECS